MSPDEIRQQKMLLRIELEDGEKHLGALRVKAEIIADKLGEMSEWLCRRPETHIFREGYSNLYKQPIGAIQPLKDAYVNALDVRPMLEVSDQIREELLHIATVKEKLGRL